MERDQDYPPATAHAEQGYERAMQRLEAALDLALDGGGHVDSATDVRRHLDAARVEIGRIRLGAGVPDLALARMLARRITADPRLSLTSQRARGDVALKTLLQD